MINEPWSPSFIKMELSASMASSSSGSPAPSDSAYSSEAGSDSAPVFINPLWIQMAGHGSDTNASKPLSKVQAGKRPALDRSSSTTRSASSCDETTQSHRRKRARTESNASSSSSKGRKSSYPHTFVWPPPHDASPSQHVEQPTVPWNAWFPKRTNVDMTFLNAPGSPLAFRWDLHSDWRSRQKRSSSDPKPTSF